MFIKTFDMKYISDIFHPMLDEILINRLFIHRDRARTHIRDELSRHLDTIKPLEVGLEKDWLQNHIGFLLTMRQGSLQKDFDKHLQKAYKKICQDVFESLRDEARALDNDTGALNVDAAWQNLQDLEGDFEGYVQASLNFIEGYRNKIEQEKIALAPVTLAITEAALAAMYEEEIQPDAIHEEEIQPDVVHEEEVQPDAVHEEEVQPDAVHEEAPLDVVPAVANDLAMVKEARLQSLTNFNLMLNQFEAHVFRLASKDKKEIAALKRMIASLRVITDTYVNNPAVEHAALRQFKEAALPAITEAQKTLGKHDLGKFLVDLAAAVLSVGISLLVNKYKNNTFFRPADNQRLVKDLKTTIETQQEVNPDEPSLPPRAQ